MTATSSCHLFIWSWAAIGVYLLSLSSILGGAIAGKSKDIIDGRLLSSKIATNLTILVGPEEEFKSVQAAINAVPDGNSRWIIVHLRAGIYRYVYHHRIIYDILYHASRGLTYTSLDDIVFLKNWCSR